MGKNKRGKRSEARTQSAPRTRTRKRLESSQMQQLNENSKEIQVIRENLKRKIEEVKAELKTVLVIVEA